METINDRISLILREFNLNKNSLSVKLGYINNTSTGKIINGIQKPGYDFVFRLLQTFRRIDANWLIAGEGKMLRNDVSYEEKIALYEKEIKYLTDLVDTKNQLIDQLKIVNKRNDELLVTVHSPLKLETSVFEKIFLNISFLH